MIIVTAANSIGDSFNPESGFSFKEVILDTTRRAEEYGYRSRVYDLGGLGFGEPYQVDDPTFQKEGYYTEIQKGYRSRSLFKPEILLDSLERDGLPTVYLDGDAQLYNRLDDVFDGSFDVGVTLREASEMRGEWYEQHYEIAKFINAGVVFLEPTPAATDFLERWKTATAELGNDQKALNALACPERLPAPYSVAVIDDVRIKYFPCALFNYYFFEDGFPLFSPVRVLHFKGVVRRFYPFTLKWRLYCTLVSPLVCTACGLAPAWLNKALKERRDRSGR